MADYNSFRQIEEWLSVDANRIQLKKDLNKLTFLLIIGAYLLPGGLSEFSFWLAIFIAIFLTYLNWKFKQVHESLDEIFKLMVPCQCGAISFPFRFCFQSGIWRLKNVKKLLQSCYVTACILVPDKCLFLFSPSKIRLERCGSWMAGLST